MFLLSFPLIKSSFSFLEISNTKKRSQEEEKKQQQEHKNDALEEVEDKQ